MRKTLRDTYREVYEEHERAKTEREEIRLVAIKQAEALIHDIVGRNLPKGMRNTVANREKVKTACAAEIASKTQELPSVVRYHVLNDAVVPGLRMRLKHLALITEALPGDLKVFVKCVPATTYHTQGLGAESYARGAVNVTRRSHAEYHPTIRTEVLTEDDSGNFHPFPVFYLAAYVREPMDKDIIERGPGFTLKEYLQACWAEGCNPRVFTPGLEHGLEEKLGLDRFGGERKVT